MNKLINAFCLLLSLCIISCKGDEEELPKTLRLSKITETYPKTETKLYLFKYDEKGKLREHRFQGGMYKSDIIQTYIYNGQDQISEISEYDYSRNPSFQRKWILSYNSEGQATKISDANGGIDFNFKYNAQGRISEVMTGHYLFIFEYNSKGNMIEQKKYIDQGETKFLATSINLEYDDKPNPFYNLGSSISNYDQIGMAQGLYIPSPSPNNIVMMTLQYFSQDGKVTESYTDEFKYKYGEGNLPIEITQPEDMNGFSIKKLEYSAL